MDKAVVLLSGGMDSAVALHMAAREHYVAASITYNYGQRGASFEALAAVNIVSRMDQSIFHLHREIHIFADSSLTVHDAPLGPEHKRPDGLPSSFVPGRNVILIAHTLALAYEMGARYIIGGWNSVDAAYPDCSEQFLSHMSLACSIAVGMPLRALGQVGVQIPITITSPVQHLSKTQIVERGVELGVPFGLTRSCYDNNGYPCLQCGSCIKRVEAFIEAGVEDPIVDDADWEVLTSVCK